MIPSRRPRYAVPHSRIRILLTSLALITASTHASAQEQTARLVRDINRTPVDFSSSISWVMPVGDAKKVVFPRETLAHGNELWTSDGTPKGTRLLKDLLPGPNSDDLSDPVAFGTPGNTKVAFLADDLRYYDDIWVTDGTDAGTHLVKDINPGTASSGLGNLTAVGDHVYFTAWDTTLNFRIWRSDGTEEGTVPVANYGPGTGYAIPEGLKPMAGKLYFQLYRRDIGEELHYIDLPQ